MRKASREVRQREVKTGERERKRNKHRDSSGKKREVDYAASGGLKLRRESGRLLRRR